jgi:mono/diheme cytochrome c family protein
MRRLLTAVTAALALLLPLGTPAAIPAATSAATPAEAPDDSSRLPRPQSNYLLGCGGCHGVQGVSNSKLVPDLRDQVGYFLNTQEGREYLVRVPNVAFFTVSDQELADMLNFMVFRIGGSSVPAGSVPYSAEEVARLRKQPLTEVNLTDYRNRLVETLIAQHHAPVRLRVYGSDRY